VPDFGGDVRGMDVRGWEETEALERHRLLLRMTFAVETRGRHYADRVLVEATRWLKRQNEGDDPILSEAREQLRAEFPLSTKSLRVRTFTYPYSPK
jgi:hypothetical protein